MPYEIKREQHRHVDFKDVPLERKFLAGLLFNEVAFKKIYNNFNSECFTDLKVKRIFDKIVEYYLRDGMFVTDIHILKTMNLSEERLPFYVTMFKKLKRIGKKRNGIEYLLTCRHKLEQLYSARIIEIGVKDTVHLLARAIRGNLQDVDKAGEIIKNLSQSIVSKSKSSVKLNPVTNFNKWLSDFEQFQKHPDKMKGIPTGIPLIDDRITGLRDSEFGLVMGESGVGKSIFLLEVGVNAWLKFGNVLYITIEMPANQLEERFWCNVSGIPYDYFRKLALTKEHKEKLAQLARRFQKHDFIFHIVDMPEGCSVPDIAAQVEPYVRTCDISMIVVDYMNIIAGDEGNVSLDWETQVGIAMNLKQNIARRFKKPVWSGCQVTGDAIAFSKHIKDNADAIVKLSENEDTEMSGIMEVSYPKARDFKGTKHWLKTDRRVMRMYRPEKTAEEREFKLIRN